MINDENDYGYYWDVENSEEIINNYENTNIYNKIEEEEDDPYEEYLDRYEQHLRYEDNQLQKIYKKNYKTSSVIMFIIGIVNLFKHYFR
jgi:hypothetical protein